MGAVSLHPDEFRIGDSLVRHLLASQCPQWASEALTRIGTSGTVNILYRLGKDKVVRLPRAPAFSGGPERASRWMPVFASQLPLVVPEYLVLGEPIEDYPSRWSILEWVEGAPASRSTLDDMYSAARALGEFVAALRTVPTDGAPDGGNYRAFGLARRDDDFRAWVERLPDDIDAGAALEVWDDCLQAGQYTDQPRWLHTDLRGDNLIARDGNVVAVIDWEGCTVGDPSADHLAAWWLFDGDAREAFRLASGATDDAWRRAKGWALHMAVAAIPYYAKTNPSFADQAHHALDQLLRDESR